MAEQIDLGNVRPGIAAMVEAAVAWARSEERVRALICIGSIGRGVADRFSDADLIAVVPSEANRRHLWERRATIVSQLGDQPTVLREITALRPYLLEVHFAGVLVCDLALEDLDAAATFAADGHLLLVDKDGMVEHLPASTTAEPIPAVPPAVIVDWVWDWAWTIYKLIGRGRPWAAATSLAQLLHLFVYPAFLPDEDRGRPGWEHSEPAETLDSALAHRFGEALPTSLEPEVLHACLVRTMALVRALGPEVCAAPPRLAADVWHTIQRLPTDL